MAATIEFKAKVKCAYHADSGDLAYCYVDVPVLATRHCDMAAFRKHVKYGGIANSTLFPNALARIRRDILRGRDVLRVDAWRLMPATSPITESSPPAARAPLHSRIFPK